MDMCVFVSCLKQGVIKLSHMVLLFKGVFFFLREVCTDYHDGSMVYISTNVVEHIVLTHFSDKILN